MNFSATPIAGVFVIEPERAADQRGFFARLWCAEAFAAHGIEASFTQASASVNRLKGTLRGLHYQAPPHGECKLIRCVRGAAFDVAVDLRPGSATRGHWISVELTAGNTRMILIPEGIAHGFQTLADDTELAYQISAAYHPEAARGVRWDDPDLAIAWPLADPILSLRDRNLPPFKAAA